jgi:hypothetical protein
MEENKKNFKPNDVILNQYTVVKIIGNGGMHSVIYLVNDKSVNVSSYFDYKLKLKAVKVINKTDDISDNE